jgi:beta-galactosidase/beta-glucuronidase
MQLLAAVKALGANTIRIIGHPPHPALPAWCDRFGIFLLEELPLYYLTETHFRQPQFAELALLQAREMIFRDLTHPSILS